MNLPRSVRTMAVRALFAASVLILGAPQAWAALSISTGTTTNVSCANNVCTATAKNAVLNVGELQGMLAAENVKVATGADAADLIVKNALSWVSSNTLTLDAYHSIVIDKPVTSTGSGGLTILDNDGGTDGTLSFGLKGNVTFWNLSAPLTINVHAYTLIDNIATLATDIAANPGDFYALAKSYNAHPDGIYTDIPVPATLTGVFQGLGNTISNVKIRDRQNAGNIGLFADIEHGASVRDLRVSNIDITVLGRKYPTTVANVGGLAGLNSGLLRNVTVSGNIAAPPGAFPRKHNPALYENVGGLVGFNDGDIQTSGTGVTISSEVLSYVGGLVGYDHMKNPGDAISGSYATGAITATENAVGGLVGYFDGPGSISYSYATGNITSSGVPIGLAGGLVGYFAGTTISHSYATNSVGLVNGGGGLAGFNSGTITNCHASGGIKGAGFYVGGLVGTNQGMIDSSFASGAVSQGVFHFRDHSRSGGLVGDNESYNGSSGLIINSYSTGNVTAGNHVVSKEITGFGGLMGINISGKIQTSYSTGAVTAAPGAIPGGLLGYDQSPSGNLSSAFWDTTTSGITASSQGAGNIANDPGITGLTNTQLQSGLPAGFSASIWGQNSAINGGLPYLLSNPPPG